MADLEFEWDSEKASSNLAKHGVSFEEALTVFFDPHSITIVDSRTYLETRYIDIGLSGNGRLLIVVYTERLDTIRIISGRQATSKEIKQYEQGF